jgi:uncharacterized protein
MGHKVKIRVGLKSGKTEKMSFTVEEGKTVRLNGEIPGMAVFAALVGDPQVTVCRLSMERGALVASASTKGPDLLYNEKSCRESKVRVGDKINFDNGWIEFLEAPEWVEEEAATKFVSLATSDRTAMFSNPDQTKVMTSSAVQESAQETATEVASKAAYKNSQEEISHKPSHKKNHKNGHKNSHGIGYEPVAQNTVRATVRESVQEPIQEPINEAAKPAAAFEHEHTVVQGYRPPVDGYQKDDATGMIMAAQAPEQAQDHVTARMNRNTGVTTGVKAFIPFYKSVEFWKQFAISFAMIAFFGEVAALIGFGSKYDFSPIPTPYSGLTITAFFALLSGGFYLGNRLWYSRGSFEEYFRSFAWFSTLLVPFALSFSFPKSVIIFASFLLAAGWIGIFAIRYFGQIPRFIPVSVGSWVFILFATFHWGAHIEWAPVIHGTPDGGRDVAGEPSPAEVAPAAPVAAAPAPVAAPPQPQQVLAPATTEAATAANTAHLATESNQLALDPMAQEQFFDAVKSGNLSRVQSFVDRHVIDPVFTLDHGSTALHYAAAQGDLRIVKYLVSKKVNIDAQDAGGTTALMWASYKHHPKVVEYLIGRKANLAIRREGGDRALEIARGVDDKEVLKMLKEAMRARHLANVHSRH